MTYTVSTGSMLSSNSPIMRFCTHELGCVQFCYMYHAFRSLAWARVLTVTVILWLGGIVLELKGEGILAVAAYRIANGGFLFTAFLSEAFILCAYALLAVFAARWYFLRSSRGQWKAYC